MKVKYPHVKLKLSDEDGNAFAILGRLQRSLRQANVPADEIKAVMEEATSGDYDHLLQVILRTVQIE